MTVTIAEELLLLAYSETEGKSLISGIYLEAAVAGAIVAELAVTERVELTNKKVAIRDRAPLGEEELDATLARLVEDGKERRPVSWVQRISRGKPSKRLLAKLAERGVLSEEHGKVLGMFPTTRWPEVDSGVEAEVRERVSGALSGADPDARTAVLIALLHASSLDKKVFPGASKKRIKEITEGAWAADAVAKTIAAVNAAVMAGVTAATTSAVANSGS